MREDRMLTMASQAYLYGAGHMGREVLAHWRATGREPAAFIDRAAERVGSSLDGVPVIALDAVTDAGDSEVLVALHSPGADVGSVASALARAGFGRVDTLWAACHRESWLPAMPYWLAPEFDWDAASASIASARGLLEDDASRELFDDQVRLRRDGRYDVLGRPTPEDQYLPADLPRWAEPMRLVDCGAFDGDTIRAIRAAGYRLAECIALEPDPLNFARLERAFAGDATVRPVRAGAHASDGVLSFASGTGPSARVDAAGTTEVPVLTLDALCADFSPTLIKMDIEGAERDALAGAAETLRRCRPGLAISVYHLPDDLWRIPLWIDALGLGYRFHLRSHSHCGFDTVLYATT